MPHWRIDISGLGQNTGLKIAFRCVYRTVGRAGTCVKKSGIQCQQVSAAVSARFPWNADHEFFFEDSISFAKDKNPDPGREAACASSLSSFLLIISEPWGESRHAAGTWKPRFPVSPGRSRARAMQPNWF
jgi:hypothetical protein